MDINECFEFYSACRSDGFFLAYIELWKVRSENFRDFFSVFRIHIFGSIWGQHPKQGSLFRLLAHVAETWR